MSLLQTYLFNNSAEYNKTNVEVDEDLELVKLSLIDNPGQIFAQNFANDTGFIYDNTKAEFTGGLLRQKDQRPANATFGATFTSSIDANWSTGVGTGTAGGGAAVAAGKLVCNGTTKYVDWAGSGNFNFAQIGTIKFKITPNYSGTPAGLRYLLCQGNVAGSRNATMQIFHSSADGNLAMFLRDDADNLTAGHSFGLFNPTAGTEYEIELDYNFTSGATRMFVNGVQLANVLTATLTRSLPLNVFRIGADYSGNLGADSSYDDIVCFSTVQHTSGYTPGYTLPEYIYTGSKVDGPNFTYTGVGTVQSIDDGSVTEVGFPRYIVGGEYWNGSAWVASNGSYAQANTFATALTNLASFDTGGGGVLPWSVVFTDSNTLSSVDDFSVEVTGQKYSLEGHLEPISPIEVQSLIEYSQVVSVSGNTDVTVILKIDGVLKWFNAGVLSTSDGSAAQSNTVSELNAGLVTLELGQNSTVYLRWVLSTVAINETPTLDTAEIEYEFGSVPMELATCIVHGYVRGITGEAAANTKVSFGIEKEQFNGYVEANKNIISKYAEVTTDSNGYFSVELVRSSEFENEAGTYNVTIRGPDNLFINVNADGTPITFTVPDATTKDITDLLNG